MHIGIDATMLPAKPGGAGNYIIQLIRALASLDTRYRFTIFAHKNALPLLADAHSTRLNWYPVPNKHPAHRLVWEQTFLPLLARRTHINLLHSLHYTRPVMLNCKSVVTFHDMTFFLLPESHTPIKRLFFPAVMRMSAKLADALITISHHTREDVIKILNIPPQKIVATPLGIDPIFHPIEDLTQLEETRHKYQLPDQFILYVGAIEPRKNLPLLIRAYNNLVQDRFPHHLVLVGQLGWMYNQVFHLIEALNLGEKVQFCGYIPQIDLPIVYNLAKVLVYPSSYEGFGLPPLEAMACGTPVITSDVSAMVENIGQAGLLIPPNDESALTQALGQLLSNPELHEQLAIQGCRQAEKFTWQQTAQQTLEVYQRVLEAR